MGMLIAVKPFAMVPNRPNEAHKARLHALPRHFNTSGDGNIVKVSCRTAAEMTQQTLAGLRPHGFLTVYGMCHSTESAVVISYHISAI